MQQANARPAFSRANTQGRLRQPNRSTLGAQARRPALCRGTLYAALALAGLATPPLALADGDLTPIPLPPGNVAHFGSTTGANAVSADGSIVVGSYADNSINLRAFQYSGGASTQLPSLGGTRDTPNAISGDGSTIVGYSNLAVGGARAVYWRGGAVTNLGTLSGGGTESQAAAVSTNGSFITGYSKDGGVFQAVRWNNGTPLGLGFLAGGTQSYGQGISGDGSIVVGQADDASAALFAVSWTLGGGMINLGTLTGGSTSTANAISTDGHTIVGTSDDTGGVNQAVRWSNGSLTPVSLGFLSGGGSSSASAVNANGSVIVGSSGATEGTRGYRWTAATGMQRINDWLAGGGVSATGWAFNNATGVNANGNVVVGSGLLAGVLQGYIARVGSATSSSGVVGLTDLAGSLAGAVAPSTVLDGLLSLTLNGAHHRTLMDSAITGRDNCGWVTGDLGGSTSGNHASALVGETGLCHDFAGRSVRVGLGVGHSQARQDQDNNGQTRLRGEYLLGEIDWAVPGTPLVASLLGISGRWKADIRRGYTSAGTAPSSGSPDISVTTVRARLDWRNAFTLATVRFSPSLAYTETRSTLAAYTETDGSAPASFDAQTHRSKESRATLTGAYALAPATELRGNLEWVHRFDRNTAGVSGSVNALGIVLPFNLPGARTTQDWSRVGIELDHRLGANTLVSLSANLASSGQDNAWTAAASFKYQF